MTLMSIKALYREKTPAVGGRELSMTAQIADKANNKSNAAHAAAF
jgi:hypothetical protein